MFAEPAKGECGDRRPHGVLLRAPWGWFMKPSVDREDDELTFHSARDEHDNEVGNQADAVAAGPEEEEWEWKASFEGVWRLEHHQDDYDYWLALKGIGKFARKVAAQLPATKKFIMSNGGDQVVHVYTLAGTMELTQKWTPNTAGEWRKEHENGQPCLISSEWGDRSLIIRKQFTQQGIEEYVENCVTADGKRLISTMKTTVVRTRETRSTRDTFVRIR